MRILFTCVGAYGHFFPLVPLARALALAGNDVAFATAEAFAPEVESAGFDVLPTGLSQEERTNLFRPYREGMEALAPEQRRAALFVNMFARIAAPANLPELLPAARSWRPDVVVHESAELAAPIVAVALGLPSVHHGYGRMVPSAILAQAAEVVGPLWARAGLEAPPFGGTFRDLYVDPCPPSLQPESPPIERVALVRPVGFDGLVGGAAQDWLDRLPNRPTVYVTLGTVFNDAPAFRVLLEGLVGEDLNVIVTTGPNLDPAELGAQPPNIHVERFVPQSAILRHATAIVTNGGSGSVLAALAKGLPMVVVPRGADQFDNAQASVKAGTAIRIMPAELTPAAVRKAVARVLSDAKYRNAAHRVQAEIAKMPSPAAAVGIVESLVSS